MTDEQKEALGIDYVDKNSLFFKKGEFGEIAEFDIFRDGRFSIEVCGEFFIFTAAQSVFIAEWILKNQVEDNQCPEK